MARRLFWFALCAGFVFLLAVWIAGSMLIRPVQATVGDPPPSLEARRVEFRSGSGALVRGWLSVAPGGKGVVLLLPGVRANRLSMVDRALFLRRAGYSVLLIDLQATGETKGEAITFGWRERHDVIAAVAFLRRELPKSRVAILGSSLGGAAALLATPPLDVDAMILEAVYPTLERATANRLTMRFGVLGRLGAPLLLAQLRLRLGVTPSELRPADHIANVRCPLLVMSGANDRHTTRADTELLYSRARPPKFLWMVAGAAHVDLHRAAKGEYEKRVLEFLRSAHADVNPHLALRRILLKVGRCGDSTHATGYNSHRPRVRIRRAHRIRVPAARPPPSRADPQVVLA